MFDKCLLHYFEKITVNMKNKSDTLNFAWAALGPGPPDLSKEDKNKFVS